MKTDFEIAEDLAAKYMARTIGLTPGKSTDDDYFECNVHGVAGALIAALNYKAHEAIRKSQDEINTIKAEARARCMAQFMDMLEAMENDHLIDLRTLRIIAAQPLIKNN